MRTAVAPECVCESGRKGKANPETMGVARGRQALKCVKLGAMLQWTAVDLAAASKVRVATVRRVEVVDGEIPVTPASEAARRHAFEAAGIEFVEENGTGEGVDRRIWPIRRHTSLITGSRSI
jgi:hypothetical protein